MSRTFRNTSIKPTIYNQYDNPRIEICRKGCSLTRYVYMLDISREFYRLYRDKQDVSYKNYRKYDEQKFKTYARRYIREAVNEGEQAAFIKNSLHGLSGWWD